MSGSKNQTARLSMSLKESQIRQNDLNRYYIPNKVIEFGTRSTGQRKSKTASSFRNHRIDQTTSSFQVRKKVQSKTPILRNSSSQQIKNQKLRKLQNLGLEDFMKELIVGSNNSKVPKKDYSSQIIQALNKTYVNAFKAESPQRSLPGKFTKRRISPTVKSPQVDWNPEKQAFQGQFMLQDSFVPSYMFPCRKQQTSRLKSRNFGSYQNCLKRTPILKVQADNPIQQMRKKINEKAKINFKNKNNNKSKDKQLSKNKQRPLSEKRAIRSFQNNTQSPLNLKKLNLYY